MADYKIQGTSHMSIYGRGLRSCISQLVEAQVRVNPNFTIAQIIQSIQGQHITITKRKACIARNLAIQRVFGNWEESYKELPRFMLAMQKYNPGTAVVFDSVPTTPGVCMFRYVFWALSGSIKGFVHCRPLVAIDGTFLTGKYKGVLLIANSVDANGQIFPLAFAVVDSESESSWGFFLKCLRLHVAKDRVGICLISDRSNAIKAAVSRQRNGWADEPFDVFHCHCIRHYKGNFEKRFKCEVLSDLMDQAARKHQVRKFERVMETIKSMNEEAAQWLRSNCPVDKWTLSHDKGKRYGHLTSNLVESFNSLLKGARGLPITAMVEAIFYKLSEFFAHRYKKACDALKESEMAVTPNVYKKISWWQKKAGSHILKPHNMNPGVYTVVTQRRPRGGGNLQTVNFAQHYCSCGKWVIYQIPCSHVIAVCQNLAYNWKRYVGEELYVRTWKKQYENTIMPIQHQDYWPQYKGVIYKPNDALRRGRGRPQTKRMSCDMDFKSRKRSRQSKNYKSEGHSAPSCNARTQPPSAGHS